jgi:hypothetical protein
LSAWLPTLIVATAWFIHLAVSYFLAWVDCVNNQSGLLISRHLVTAIGLGITVVTLSMAQRDTVVEDGPHDHTKQVLEQSFMARLSVATGLMFLFAVLLAGAANLFLAPCV